MSADLGEEPGPGNVLEGKYEIIDLIGSGAMSRVYSAKHLVLDRTIVVKVLHHLGEYEEEAKERFRREVRIVVSLRHDNIVKVSDAGVLSNGCPYIIMPYLEGETLKAWMKRTPLENRDLLFSERIIIDICQGLYAAHEKNIIHRDLKPQNIYLHRSNEDGHTVTVPKILDFGVARDLSATKVTRLTLPSQSFGTEGYMSPEQAKGDDPDKRSDIFSVGCILYELLTDEKVNPFERMVPPMKVNHAVPRALSNACMKALEPSPDRRYQSALDFADDLCYRVADIPLKAAHRRRPRVLLIFSLLAVPIFMAGAFVVLRGNGSLWSETKTVSTDTADSIPDAVPEKQPEKNALPPKEPAKKTDIPPVPAKQTNPMEQPPVTADSNTASAIKQTTPHQPSGRDGKTDVAISPAETARIDSLLLEAESLLRQKRFADAEPALQEVARLRPREARAWYGLGTVAFQKEDYQTSVHQMEKALKLRDKIEWRIMLGHACLANHQKDRARSEWRKILSSPNISETTRESVENLLLDLGDEVE